MVGRIATGEIEDADKANSPPAKPIKRLAAGPQKNPETTLFKEIFGC
jgi:hypothetical protein